MHETNSYTEHRHRQKEEKIRLRDSYKIRDSQQQNVKQGVLGVIHSPLRDALAERYPPSKRFGLGRRAGRDKDMNSALGNDACMTARRAVLLNGAFEGSECPRGAPSRPELALGLVAASHILVCSNDVT